MLCTRLSPLRATLLTAAGLLATIATGCNTSQDTTAKFGDSVPVASVPSTYASTPDRRVVDQTPVERHPLHHSI